MQDVQPSTATPSEVYNSPRNHVQELTAEAVQLKYEIDNAKTNLKKEYFRKKLLKVNKKVYALLAQLQWQDAITKARKELNEEAKSDIQEELKDDSEQEI